MQNTPASRTWGCGRILTHGESCGCRHRMESTDMNANTTPSRYFALIPCAGNGSRAGTAGPKQYERVAGQPMVWHTLSAFAGVKRIARTLVVVAPGDGFFERNPTTSALVVQCGGATRASSVTNGLRELRRVGATDNDWEIGRASCRERETTAGDDESINQTH